MWRLHRKAVVCRMSLVTCIFTTKLVPFSDQITLPHLHRLNRDLLMDGSVIRMQFRHDIILHVSLVLIMTHWSNFLHESRLKRLIQDSGMCNVKLECWTRHSGWASNLTIPAVRLSGSQNSVSDVPKSAFAPIGVKTSNDDYHLHWRICFATGAQKTTRSSFQSVLFPAEDNISSIRPSNLFNRIWGGLACLFPLATA